MMTAMRSSKLIGPVSAVLTVMMVGLLLPAPVLPQASAQGQQRLLLIFPVLDNTEGAYPDAARRLTDALQISIDEIAGLRAAEFSKTSPMVRRAVEEGQIRSVDVEAEVADPVTALRIGYALGADEVCLATITSITVSSAPRGISLLLTGQCYSVSENIDEASGQVKEQLVMSNSFGVSGQSVPRANYRGSDNVLVNEAIRSAARKAAQVLAGQPAEAAAAEHGKKKSSHAWKWLLAGMLVVGLAIAANTGTHHEATGPAPAASAPVPLRAVQEAAAIRLYWDPPQNTSLTVLRYQIQRSTDHGVTWSFIDNGTVDATDTSFADFNVTSGVSYRYRIRAQFTETGPSPWAMFNDIQFN